MNTQKNVAKKIIISLIFLCVIYASLPTILYSAANYYAGKKDNKHIAEELYLKVVKYFPYSSKAPNSLESLIISKDLNSESILITNNFTSSSLNNYIPSSEGVKYYKILAQKYPKSQEAKAVSLKIGRYYDSIGDYAQAEKNFLQGLKEDKDSFVHSESNENLIKLYLKNKNPKKALEYIEIYRNNYPESLQAEMYFLEGDAYQTMGNFNKAEKTYKKVLKIDQENLGLKDEKVTNNFYQEKLEEKLFLNKLKADNVSNEKSKISGFLNKDGKAVKNGAIYLVDENKEKMNFSTNDIENYPVTYVNDQGYYEFTDIIPGKYSLGLVIPKNDIEGHTLVPERKVYELIAGQTLNLNLKLVPLLKLKEPDISEDAEDITLQWEKVKDAHSYTIMIGWVKRNKDGISFSNLNLREHIPTNELVISKEEILNFNSPQQEIDKKTAMLKAKSVTIESSNKTKDELKKNPSLLSKNGQHELLWSVKAYDKDNNLITDSSGFEFFIDNARLNTFFISEK